MSSRNPMPYLGMPPCPKTEYPKQVEGEISIHMINGFLPIKLTMNTMNTLPQTTIKTFISNEH